MTRMLPTVRSWLLRPGPLGGDGLVAAALVAVMLIELRRTGVGDLPLSSVLGVSLLICGAVAWRRVAAVSVAIIVYSGVLGLLLAGFEMDNLGQFFAHLLASYSLGAHTRGRAAHPVVAVGVVTVVSVLAVLTIRGPDAVGLVVLLAGLCLLGRVLRRRDRTVADLRSETELLQREREERAAAAVAEERARIARELHDVVAHAVSLMVLQTGAGRKVLGVDPERATAVLASAEETGRQALAEMKRLVGIMRAGETSLAPQPGLRDVEALVESARRSGKPVDHSVVGDAVDLPPGLDLAAYRIVQEALTNSIRHAELAPACVRVGYETGAVTLEVSDAGTEEGLVWPPPTTGHGLAGMRERTELYDGTIDLGPNGRGGLRVVVRLPLQRAGVVERLAT